MIESDGLVIQNVNRDNAGTYTCRARVPETGELEERDIQLDVSILYRRYLHLQSQGSRDRGAGGEGYTARCKYTV